MGFPTKRRECNLQFEAEEDILKCCYSQNNWIILTQTAASYIWHLYSDHWDYV